MSAVGSISVLMPILNGEEFLERVLKALRAQKTSIPWDFLAVDCGSTDRTLAIFDAYSKDFPVPLRVHQIHQSEFNHGDTRNLLVALCSGELAIFLTDDAIPMGTDWLQTIAANFEDEEVAACHVRNLPRPEVSDLLKVTSARDPNYQAGKKKIVLDFDLYPEDLDGAARRALYNYNDVASAVRRSIWERYPYPHCDFGEDVLLGRAVLEAGQAVVFEDAAWVEHSHEYDCNQLFERGRSDALFNVEHLQYRCVEHERDVAALVERKLELDRRDLEARGLSPGKLTEELLRSAEEATAFFSGMHAGSRSERRFRGSGLNATAYPTIEAHGVPEATKRALSERGWTFLAEGEGADVVHVHAVGDLDSGRIRDSVLAGRPVLGTVSHRWALEHGMQRALLGAIECESPELLERAPEGLAFGPAPSVPPFELMALRDERELGELRGPDRTRVVTAVEEGLRLLEMRYRALASTLMDARGHCPLDRRGDEAIRTEGDAASITDGRLLLRAEAAAEWDVRGVPPGPYRLLVSLDTLGMESGVVTGGQVLVDDELVGTLGPYLNGEVDERRHLQLPLQLGPGCERLRLQARTPGGAGTILRVGRVRLLDDTHAFGRRSVEECSLDLTGHDGVPRRRSAHEGCDMLRVGPKRGTADWRVDGLPKGRYRLRVWLAFGEGESRWTQAGRVKLDGQTVARFSGLRCPVEGGTHLVEANVELPGGGSRVSVSNRRHPLGLRGLARVQRLRLTPLEIQGAGDNDPDTRAPMADRSDDPCE